MGCPGTKRGKCRPRKRRAHATTSRLVLPASVTTAWGGRCGAMAVITAAIWPTGVASSTKSASRTARAASCDDSSMILRLSASARLARVRPTPTTRFTARARLRPSANDPPIRPTPMTTSLPIRGLAIVSGRDGLPERFQEAGVLRRQPDGNAQVPGHAVACHRTHDHARLEQLPEHGGSVRDPERHEIAERRDVFELQPREALGHLAHARAVELVAAAHEIVIVERGGRRRERHAVDVER